MFREPREERIRRELHVVGLEVHLVVLHTQEHQKELVPVLDVVHLDRLVRVLPVDHAEEVPLEVRLRLLGSGSPCSPPAPEREEGEEGEENCVNGRGGQRLLPPTD